ncbi:MAG: cell division ATP-binding protein FtsE [Acidobacteria bacterium]|nr:cell division ATP-binding protein FtsE [Acidobacteriota bacterium]MCB9377914.1 cell division ATP-binding protein FtsE [Holophagales bacterium]
MIHFFHVSRRFPTGQAALADVTFEIAKGEFCFLTGPSGAGKSTLLRLIFREDSPTEGQILVNGRNVASIPLSKVPYLRRTIGVVFQDYRLIDRRTVFENIAYLPQVLGFDQQRQKRVVFEALRRVGLAHRMKSFPPELSGGEKQRIAIARALVAEPEILIADEPTGNLDPDLAREIHRLFLEIHQRGTTVLFATHDLETVQRLGRRVLTLAGGRLVADRPATVHASPPPSPPPEPPAAVDEANGPEEKPAERAT